MGQKMDKMSVPIYIYVCIYPITLNGYISVAKPYGRFGQKLESLQAGQEGQGSRRQGRGRHGRTGQGRGTYQKRTEQKQSRAWAKSRAGHDGHCAIWISKCAGQGQNAEQGKKGQNKVSRFGQL